MNEAETRAEHIDPALEAAGWGVVDGSRIRREYHITAGRLEGQGRRGKPLIADYVLEYRNTKLAVIEAKAWDQALTEGVAQAKDYAGKLAVRFAYSTNGSGIYGIDMADGDEAEVADIPDTGRTLESHLRRGRTPGATASPPSPFEDKGGSHPGRYYQDIAVERVLEAIANGESAHPAHARHRHRQDLHRLSDRLEAVPRRWNLSREPTRRPRILFLADRNILANQAYNAFSAFPEDAMVRIAPADIRKKGKVPKNGSLFFTIFQTFMSGRRGRQPRLTSASIRPTSSTSSSSTNAIAAARMTKATGAASSTTSRPPCSSG